MGDMHENKDQIEQLRGVNEIKTFPVSCASERQKYKGHWKFQI